MKDNSVYRPKLPEDVESFELTKWDKNGNVVSKPQPKKPSVKEDVTDVPVEKVKVPTVKELEALQESAYNEGFERGFQNGHEQGLREGTAEGKAEGLKLGQEEGKALGLEEGKKAGHAQALAEETRKTEAKLQVLDTVSQALKTQVQEEQTELEQALTSLAARLARQVLQDELRSHPDHIRSIVQAAVRALPNPEDKLTVMVNPKDLDLVKQCAESHWSIVADEAISPGGCEVKSAYSYIDYTLEKRFTQSVSQLVSQVDPQADESRVTSAITQENLIEAAQNAKEESAEHANDRIDTSDFNESQGEEREASPLNEESASLDSSRLDEQAGTPDTLQNEDETDVAPEQPSGTHEEQEVASVDEKPIVDESEQTDQPAVEGENDQNTAH